MVTDRGRLLRIKLLHTAVWAVFAGAIVALYPAVALEAWGLFLALNVLILGEIVTLSLFGWKCPLTLVAERYTDDRRPNFDIFLPAPLAEHNKPIFTAILLLAWVYAVLRWVSL